MLLSGCVRKNETNFFAITILEDILEKSTWDSYDSEIVNSLSESSSEQSSLLTKAELSLNDDPELPVSAAILN